MTETVNRDGHGQVVGPFDDHLGHDRHAPCDRVPAVGPLIGVDITGDLVQNAGDDVVVAVQAVAALVGYTDDDLRAHSRDAADRAPDASVSRSSALKSSVRLFSSYRR